MQQEKVTLATLGKGAASELFQREFDRVLENILDPNTPAKAKRSITLKVVIGPDDDRKMGQVEISCSSKTAAPKAYPTRLFMGVDADGFMAVESNPDQMKLDFEQKTREEAKAQAAEFPKEVKGDA